MNSAHDMGGMQSFGPVCEETDQPVFHAPWEGGIFAIFVAPATLREWDRAIGPQSPQAIPALEYLSSNDHHLGDAQVVELVVQNGLAKPDEVESGKPVRGFLKANSRLTADRVRALIAAGARENRAVGVAPKIQAGGCARNIHPPTYTRGKGYARGHLAAVERGHGGIRNRFIPSGSPRSSFGLSRQSLRIGWSWPWGTMTFNRPRVGIVQQGVGA
jgi:nitrile hydratase subunit beta